MGLPGAFDVSFQASLRYPARVFVGVLQGFRVSGFGGFRVKGTLAVPAIKNRFL